MNTLTSAQQGSQAYFYRFRSADALLDRFNELERQEIYFASTEELNDALEGFKEVFWRGDRILWRNLLRHYLLCLFHAISDAVVFGQDHEFTDTARFVFANESSLPTEQFRKLHGSMCDAFFAHPDMQYLPELMERREAPMRREELTTYLRLLHLHALNVVLSAMEAEGIITVRPEDDFTRTVSAKKIDIRTLFESRRTSEQEHADRPGFAEFLSSSAEVTATQLELLNEYNGTSLQRGAAWKWIISEFPRTHVRALEQLMYREWYAACFVIDPSDASMWGNYGDGHRGVALKFRASPNTAGQPSLRLWHRREDAPHNPLGPLPHDFVAHAFQKVSYDSQFIEIDFFRSLGRLTRPELHHWYWDENKNLSPTVHDVVMEAETWRTDYWDQQEKAITTKLPDWSHEEEYRLTLSSMIDSLADRSARTLTFQFHDLQGIIFGINTQTNDKLRIMRLIEAKCRQDGRFEFEFYQAHYSRRVGKVEITRMSLLKFAGL